jgi:DNA (cytosine-5)-methyltransferase 1
MRFGSVCSGIEAASVAWRPLGWRAAWLSEIEPFPSAVLKHHYPDVPNLGDMTALPKRIMSGEVEAPDLFCGGTPCQAFSVAGLRNSLNDARGNLSLTFCEIANAIDKRRTDSGLVPAIIFWENVPGVLNTKDNAFGCFLGALAGEDDPLVAPGGRWTNAGCVYGPQRAVAWRVLDAQYFGVAQRRRRVFVVASARDDFDPAAVLFESEGVRRDTAPSRETGKAVTELAGTLTANGGGLNRPAGNANELDFCITQPYHVANTLTARMHKGINSTLDEGQTPVVAYGIRTANTSSNGWGIQEEVTHTLDTAQGIAVAFQVGPQSGEFTDLAPTLDCRAKNGPIQNQLGAGVLMQTMQVRRLTTVECERLQGFPDGYTNIPWRNKDESPDGPRYKALGNSWAVPVVRWIGNRIKQHLDECV